MNSMIVPTVFAKDKLTFSNKLEVLNFSPILHIDFMDGQFTKMGKSINFDVMKDLIPIDDERKFQVHLMAYTPEKYIKNLLKIKSVYRVLLQYEAFDDLVHLDMSVNEFKSRNYEVIIVLNPQTNVSVLDEFYEKIDGVMLMSVNPGAEGQEFIIETENKVKMIREKYPQMEICIDGGLNSKTIDKVFLAGANTFCVGSYISSSDTPKENWEKLKVLVNA